jgi:UTP:GlnB (protein PII) uridylyltransferase
MQKPSLPKIRAEAAKRGDYRRVIPEFYELESVIEVNEWHDHDSVFSHTLNVLGKLEALIKKYEGVVGEHLDENLIKYSRRELLYASAMLHDIAKKDCFATMPDGTTSCPGHEGFGATKAGRILDRFDLDASEKSYVVDLVKNHGFFDDVAAPGNSLNAKKDVKRFQYDHPGMLIEMVLLSYADTTGNQLSESNPDEYKFRVDFYRNVLEEF